ncbi:MAG TPA: IS30 family transposase, partial [Candidatus Jeotgalibaca merdavium]|nr:IS30 family transposase [Candidatus Jeotgalibaca merdavium]
MLNEKWSPDVVVGFVRKYELFDFAIIPGTTALYQWIDCVVMRTKNMDLLEKLSHKIKAVRPGHRSNKRVLGILIEE